jgi:hypothetical protein
MMVLLWVFEFRDAFYRLCNELNKYLEFEQSEH